MVHRAKEGTPLFITKEQALSVIEKIDGQYHCYANPAPSIFVGCDYTKRQVIQLFSDAISIEITGPEARKMKHGIAAITKEKRAFFISTNEKNLAELEMRLKIAVED